MRTPSRSSRRASRRFVGIALGVGLLAGAGGWLALRGPHDLAAATAEVRARYPRVAQLTTGDLEAWLADARRTAPVLVDVRTASEYAISHLPAARRAEPGAVLPAWIMDLPRATPIVAYCAVGYRSSAFAERLMAAGFQDVRNLEGSIFAWANEGRWLVRTPESIGTDQVHPYDATWGQLLDAEHHAPVPSIE